MQVGKIIAPGTTVATTVAAGIGVFDPSIPAGVRTGLGVAASVVIAAYVLGHHALEAAKVSGGATVAAAKHQSAMATAAQDAQSALHHLGALVPIFGGPQLPSDPGPPPAGVPTPPPAAGTNIPQTSGGLPQ